MPLCLLYLVFPLLLLLLHCSLSNRLLGLSLHAMVANIIFNHVHFLKISTFLARIWTRLCPRWLSLLSPNLMPQLFLNKANNVYTNNNQAANDNNDSPNDTNHSTIAILMANTHNTSASHQLALTSTGIQGHTITLVKPPIHTNNILNYWFARLTE